MDNKTTLKPILTTGDTADSTFWHIWPVIAEIAACIRLLAVILRRRVPTPHSLLPSYSYSQLDFPLPTPLFIWISVSHFPLPNPHPLPPYSIFPSTNSPVPILCFRSPYSLLPTSYYPLTIFTPFPSSNILSLLPNFKSYPISQLPPTPPNP